MSCISQSIVETSIAKQLLTTNIWCSNDHFDKFVKICESLREFKWVKNLKNIKILNNVKKCNKQKKHKECKNLELLS